MKYTVMKYLRISSEDIDLGGPDKYESDSISHQRALLDDFIAATPEFQDCEITEAVDDGRTGTNFNRSGIRNVLELAQLGKIHCIIVKDLSRFGRNYLEAGNYIEQLFPAWGVRFISVNDMYDSAQYHGTTGGINIAFRNLMAGLYSQDLSDKVRSAIYNINKSGKSTAPYSFFGYIKDPDDRRKLIIDEPSAGIVRLIFNLREQGMTTTAIARKLNDDGVQTASGRKKAQGAKREWRRKSKESLWDVSIITRILADERYTGKHIYGKLKRIELGKTAVKSVPESEWIVVPDTFPAIITSEQFNRVQKIRSANVKPANRKPPDKTNLFYRKIFCGHCGRALGRRKTCGGYNYYCGAGSLKSGLKCMRGSISGNVISETVLAALNLQTQPADNFKPLIPDAVKSSSAAITELRGESKKLKRMIEKSNLTKLTLWEKQHTENLSREAYQLKSEKIAMKITEYSGKIAGLEAQIQRLGMESGQENAFAESCGKQACINELSLEIVNECIQGIHVYTPDRIEITLNYIKKYI